MRYKLLFDTYGEKWGEVKILKYNLNKCIHIYNEIK